MPKQTKTKSKSRSILLKRIHHNRWLFYAISVIVIVGGGIFSYITIANINDGADQAFLNLQPRPEYSNQSLGFGVDYPNGWVIDSSSSPDSVTFDNPSNDGESVSISTATLQAAAKLEKSPSAKVQQQYSLRGNVMIVLTVADPEGGAPNKVGIVQTPQKVFVVSGSSNQFTTFLNDIRPF
jgi:hypothetical protein